MTAVAAEQERELLAARWEQITPFFAFPPEIRRIIYTTKAVESLPLTLRQGIQTRGSFPNQEAAMKLLSLALRNIAQKWGRYRTGKKPSTASLFGGERASPEGFVSRKGGKREDPFTRTT
jgi:transposase-like protein